MKKTMLVFCGLVMIFSLSACSGKFWAGAGGGTLATGAGYEVNAQMQLNQLKKDLDSGKINKAEYDIRVNQIKQMSITH